MPHSCVTGRPLDLPNYGMCRQDVVLVFPISLKEFTLRLYKDVTVLVQFESVHVTLGLSMC